MTKTKQKEIVYKKEARAIFKDDTVRCADCEDEIIDEDCKCECGLEGSDFINLKEAFEEKAGMVRK